MLLREQVILLSGVGEGLGRDTALLFAGEGADLVLTARKPDIIEQVAAEVRALGRRCTTQLCDIEKPADCERTVVAAVAAHGRIDGLINIAYRPAWPNLTPLLDTAADLSDWRGCFDVNVWGTLQMTRSVAKHMAERRSNGLTPTRRSCFSPVGGPTSSNARYGSTISISPPPIGGGRVARRSCG